MALELIELQYQLFTAPATVVINSDVDAVCWGWGWLVGQALDSGFTSTNEWRESLIFR